MRCFIDATRNLETLIVNLPFSGCVQAWEVSIVQKYFEGKKCLRDTSEGIKYLTFSQLPDRSIDDPFDLCKLRNKFLYFSDQRGTLSMHVPIQLAAFNR